MEGDTIGEVTGLLQRCRAGDDRSSIEARAELFELVHTRLYRIASSKSLQESPDQTLGPTALVNELFVRWAGRPEFINAPNSRFFFVAAARSMHEILVDRARQRASQKRGGDFRRQPLDDILDAIEADHHAAFLDVHEALEELRAFSERQHDILKLRFYGGLALADVAESLEVSLSTVERDLRFASAWLRARLKGYQA